MSERPRLSRGLAPADFLDHYWLRDELADFCRSISVSATGSKQQLTERVAAVLAGGAIPTAKSASRHGVMPSQFSTDTIIGKSWRCSQSLRAFLSAYLGHEIKFDGALRGLIHTGEGRALGDVIKAWRTSAATGENEISPQFEYNRFVRAYRRENPSASHPDVVSAWRRHRAQPKSKRSFDP